MKQQVDQRIRDNQIFVLFFLSSRFLWSI
jgi:hypothetical protein